VACAGLFLALLPSNVAFAEPVELLFTDGIDQYADYDGADSCSPADKPGAVALRTLVLTAYPGTTGGIGRSCSGSGSSEHHEGRALDWMVSAYTQEHLAADLLAWLLADDSYGNEHAMARRLGVMYIIWNHEVWRAYAPEDGWQPYNGSNPHTDHVHISMSWDGALRETTWFTGAEVGMRLDQARFAATWRGPSRLDVFRRGASGDLQLRTWAGSWGDWKDLDGSLSSGPAAVWARRTLWVFARGTDGALHQRRWKPSSGWKPWKATNVEIAAAPGVASQGRRIDLVVLTPASTIEHRRWKPGDGWSSWKDLGGVVTAPPAAMWRSPDRLDVIVRGATGKVYQKSKVDGTWTGWTDLGGVLASGPAVTSFRSGRLDLFVRNERGSVSHRYDLGAGWSPWLEVGGRHVSGPTASAIRDDRIDVFTRYRSGGLSQNYHLEGMAGWSGWALR